MFKIWIFNEFSNFEFLTNFQKFEFLTNFWNLNFLTNFRIFEFFSELSKFEFLTNLNLGFAWQNKIEFLLKTIQKSSSIPFTLTFRPSSSIKSRFLCFSKIKLNSRCIFESFVVSSHFPSLARWCQLKSEENTSLGKNKREKLSLNFD